MATSKHRLSAGHIGSAWLRYEAAPATLKNIAARRLEALQSVEQLVKQGRGLLEARAIVAEQLRNEGVRGGSVATLGRWATAVEGAEAQHRLALLVPAYAGRTAIAAIPPEAWDLFKADYLRPEAPTATSCYERLRRIAAVEGWALPSLRSFERKLDRELSPQVIALARQGSKALDLMYPAQERDRSGLSALEAVNADGHCFDVFVRFPLGHVARPVLIGIQDVYSGKLLAWRVGETESADLARLAFMDVVRNFGIPEHAWLDNGRGFASKALTGGAATRFRFKVRDEDPAGLLVSMGVQIHWTTPYHGQAKPIERAWRDLCDRVAKHPEFAGAYTGNRPAAKPENYGSKAVPFDVFMHVLNGEILAHNSRPGRRSRVCAGSSFDAVFNASYSASVIRRATDAQLRMMMLASEVVLASSRDGSVRLAGNRYWTEALARHCGQKLMLRFDPDALHEEVHVYTLAGVFVGTADCIAAVGFADAQAAKEHARAKQQHRRAAKQQLEAERRMSVAKLADRLPSVERSTGPVATVIAPMFGKPKALPRSAEDVDSHGQQERRESRFQNLMARMQAAQSARRTPPEEES